MEIEVSTIIARPVTTVWDFYGVNHVANHPRWDPTLELEAATDEPIGIGTVITRRTDRFGKTTVGTMEVTKFEPERVMRVRTQDGPMTINGPMICDAVNDEETRLRIGGKFPELDESMADQIRRMMEQSVATIKALTESET